MSYPTQQNTSWERNPHAMLLAPRRSRIIERTSNEPVVVADPAVIQQVQQIVQDKPLPDGNEQLGEWRQVLLCPCNHPTVCLYTMCCCCCAMGDVGCTVHERATCYAAYCLCALCPCSVGEAKEAVAEKYNLPVSSWDPEDCGFCLVRYIGMRMMCFASVCLVPCCHVAQMRAEVAYRAHGKVSVFPCCCCYCGAGEPPDPNIKPEDLDYPRAGESTFAITKPAAPAPLDYPRAGGVPPPQPVLAPPAPVLNYPKAGVSHQEIAPAVTAAPQATYPVADVWSHKELGPRPQLDYPRN